MTDHPKPIARYDVVRWPSDDGPADEVIEAEFGDYVLYADHEAALAAAVREAEERTVERLSAMLTSDLKVIADIGFPQTAIRVQRDGEAKDARIAELERERDELKHDMEQAIDGRNAEARANEELRTAIEALARELQESGQDYWERGESCLDPCGASNKRDRGEDRMQLAADLLALLEKKP